MNTDDLILQLSEDTPAVRRGAVGRRLAVGIAAGALVSAVLVLAWLGPRGDLGAAIVGSSYWIKWTYTLSLAAAALAVMRQLARPDSGHLRGVWLVAVPVVLLGIVGAIELAGRPSAEWLAMWLGQSWKTCPWWVLTLSGPIFVGLLWSFRRLAPTRLRAAGAAAGMTSGAFAASVYCLHCPEASAIFVLTWYSLGILLATLIGAVLGPRLLRW